MIGAVGTRLGMKDGHLATAMVLALLSAIVASGRF
jgi:hypothetical protein